MSLNAETNSTGVYLLTAVMRGRPYLLFPYSIRSPFLFLQNNQWWLIFRDFFRYRSFVPCGSAKKWPRCVCLRSDTNVTGKRRSSHINASTLICFMSSLSHFFPQPNFRNPIFSLSEFDLFPWSERKGWSQLRFANVFLITELGRGNVCKSILLLCAQYPTPKRKAFSLTYVSTN